MNIIKIKKIDCKFCFASKIDLVWSYLSQNMGVISAKDSTNTNEKKSKSSLEARKMKIEG
jgi:hypothetical protein